MAHILDTDIKFLPGIGPKRAELLGKELGIFTFRDMLYFFPFRYIDRSKVYTIRELQPTMAYIQVRGKIVSTSSAGDSPRSKRFTAILQDPTGRIELVFFKGIKWIQEKIKVGQEYVAFGKPSEFNGVINMVHPELNLPTGQKKYRKHIGFNYLTTDKKVFNNKCEITLKRYTQNNIPVRKKLRTAALGTSRFQNSSSQFWKNPSLLFPTVYRPTFCRKRNSAPSRRH